MGTTPEADGERGSQRLDRGQLKSWRDLDYGMFIHFGMSTFDGDEHSRGDRPSATYAPDRLDVDQWLSVARDAGMRYAVLTTKHVAGHCLWPSRHTDYHVGTSGCTTDVVEAFMRACARTGIKPGFYYCSWDNHHRFGSCTPTIAADGGKGDWNWQYTTRAYEDFQLAQIEELHARYGSIAEWWIDIPYSLSRGFQRHLYERMAQLDPAAVIMFNTGIGDGTAQPTPETWPTDLIAVETRLPPTSSSSAAHNGHDPWRTILGRRYHLPGEVCDTVQKRWFWIEGDAPRSDRELLGLRLLAHERGCNLLLDVGPDRHGVIPDDQVQALLRLRRHAAAVGLG